MQIQVKYGALTFTFGVEAFDTVNIVKALARTHTDLKDIQQRLLFGGQRLEDGRTLSDYNIQMASPHRYSVSIFCFAFPDLAGGEEQLTEQQALDAAQQAMRQALEGAAIVKQQTLERQQAMLQAQHAMDTALQAMERQHAMDTT